MDDEKVLGEEGEIQDDDNDLDDQDDLEDIPENFFDDFNNEGFMESLQIVDSLDDANPRDLSEEHDENVENETSGDIISSRKSDERKYSRSEGSKKSRIRDEQSKKASSDRRRKFDDTALRRDPSKTKRDMEKDRENFYKKKEQKVISKIIETGLVPPGMENEVNLNALESDKIKQVEKEGEKKREFAKSRTRERKHSREKKSIITAERRRNRSRSRSYDKYSPRFRSRSREKRTDRSREKRLERRKSFDRRERSRSRQRGRFEQDSFSPKRSKRRRSRSISDRERWLKERDPSPERKYMVREKKMSFLEEIQMKLNGEMPGPSGDMVTYPFPKNPVQPKFPANMIFSEVPQYGPNYMMTERPVMVPVTANYNEDYFIGNQPQIMPIVGQQQIVGQQPIVGQPLVAPQVLPMQQRPQTTMEQPLMPADTYDAPVRPVPAPTDTTEISAKVSELLARISASTNSNSNQRRIPSQPEKKQWNLTDFLHVNPASEVSMESDALKKKIDVLSRCQDFLKEISGEKKLTGKLRVTKPNQQPKQEQNASPLLRRNQYKFSFNTPLANQFPELLKRAMMKTGVVSEVIDLADKEDRNDDVVQAEAGAKTSNCASSSKSMKLCQTDPIKCYDCEKRRSVEVRSIGIQCGESDRYNVGVQVVEEDIVNSRLAKNQSLAYLTAAQLLGRGEPVSTRADNFGQSSAWNRSREYYEEPGRDYYGRGEAARFPRY